MAIESIILIIQIVVMFIGALITVVPTYYRMRSQRKAEEATAAYRITQSAMEFAEQCEAKIAEQGKTIKALEKNMARIEKHLRYWQRGCALLIQQLVDNDLEPVWDPNGGPDDIEE